MLLPRFTPDLLFGKTEIKGPKINLICIVTVVRAVRLVGHLILVLVRYEKGKLIYTHCRVLTPHELGRCVVQTAMALGHMRRSPHTIDELELLS